MISPTVYELIRCAICGRDRFGHNPATGYCNVWRRAEHSPYRLTAAVPTSAAAGWRLVR